MEIKKLYNLNESEINNRKNNIFIAFCLGNKFFQNEENIKQYIEWALKYTKEKVILLIADTIQLTNYIVRNKSTIGSIIKRVEKDSQEIEKKLNKILKTFSYEKLNKIKLIKWNDFECKDKFCLKTTHLVYKEFKNNISFKNSVLNAVKTSVTDRKFSEEKYFFLCDYVLDEFSLCYSGIDYERDYYGMYIYPYSDSVVDFLYHIQKSKIFPKLNKKLPTKKVKLAILR